MECLSGFCMKYQQLFNIFKIITLTISSNDEVENRCRKYYYSKSKKMAPNGNVQTLTRESLLAYEAFPVETL